VEERLLLNVSDNEHHMPSPTKPSAVVLEVTTIGGLTLSRRKVLPDTLVFDLKQSLAPHIGVLASRQQLVHGSTLLSDTHSLQDYGLSLQLEAARCGNGAPVQLSLVTLSDQVVAVPDDYGSISEAVASLPEAGGLVQLVGPPTVSGDVIEIRNPNISIIAVACGGVDVRQAKLYIKPMHTDSETHVRLHGLRNMSRVAVLRCGHKGSIAFRDCDLLPAKELHVHTGAWDKGALIFSRSGRHCGLRCDKYKNWKAASKTMYLDNSESTSVVSRIPWPTCSASMFVPSGMRSVLHGVWKFRGKALDRAMQSNPSSCDAAWPCLASTVLRDLRFGLNM